MSFIQLTSSLYSALVLFVKKKDSLLCLYVNFHSLNCISKNIIIYSYLFLVKIVDGGLYFIFSFHFYFTLLFTFLFSFLFLEQLGLGLISHAVTSVTNWWCSHKTDHETGENGVEGTRIKWRHTAWTTHAGLMKCSWSFRVGCTVVSMDHGL